MYMLQLGQVPVEVGLTLAERKLPVKLRMPKFSQAKILEWSNEIMNQRVEAMTEGMHPNARREYLAMYPPLPPDMAEMRRIVRSPEGSQYVFRTSLESAMVRHQHTGAKMDDLSGEEINYIMENLGQGPVAALAWEIADLEEKLTTKKQDDSDRAGEDPLPGTGSDASSSSRTRPSETSPSSSQLTTVTP